LAQVVAVEAAETLTLQKAVDLAEAVVVRVK
jgi:hypothetical protein